VTELLFHANTYLNAMAVAFVLFGAARPHIFAEDALIKIGAFIACFGLAGQAARNLQFLFTGISPSDSDELSWMLKDLGLCIMFLGYAMRGPIGDKLKGK
jgi:hypothetical protein